MHENKVTQIAMNEKDAAIYLGVSRGFLRKYRTEQLENEKSIAPPYVRIGKMIRYLKDDLDTWLNNHKIVL